MISLAFFFHQKEWDMKEDDILYFVWHNALMFFFHISKNLGLEKKGTTLYYVCFASDQDLDTDLFKGVNIASFSSTQKDKT